MNYTAEKPKREMWKEPWYQLLAQRLGEYKEIKARVRILRIQLMMDVMPDAKLICNYTEGGGKSHEEVSPKELELIGKENEIGEIDAALDGLTEDERGIIKLRYIEGVRDWHIYEVKIRMGKTQYYETRSKAMEQIARCLGINTKNERLADCERNTRAK